MWVLLINYTVHGAGITMSVLFNVSWNQSMYGYQALSLVNGVGQYSIVYGLYSMVYGLYSMVAISKVIRIR